MKQRLTVTVGIPAFNEEANIGRLLASILNQVQTGLIIEKIIVVNDGSSDLTLTEVKRITDRRIMVVTNRARKGQSYSQNLIFSKSKTDVVVLLEADTLPINIYFVSKLVAPILKDRRVGMVQGNTFFADPITFVGKVISSQAKIYYKNAATGSDAVYRFSTGRGGRAFAKHVYQVLRWPKNVPEDKYAALWCFHRGVKSVFRKDAVCMFKIPESIGDYRVALQKINSGREVLLSHYSKSKVQQLYKPSHASLMRMVKEFAISKPFHFGAYLFIKGYAEFSLKQINFTDFWQITKSTKNLKGAKV